MTSTLDLTPPEGQAIEPVIRAFLPIADTDTDTTKPPTYVLVGPAGRSPSCPGGKVEVHAAESRATLTSEDGTFTSSTGEATTVRGATMDPPTG